MTPVFIGCVAIIACGEPTYSEPTQPVVAPVTTVLPDERVVDIVETTPERLEIIEISKIPARNCVGENIIRFGESLSKSTTQEVTTSGGVSVAVAFIIQVSVEAKYQITTGQQIEKTVSYEIEAQPGTFLEYDVLWKEIWSDGYVVLERVDGTQRQIPYSVRTSLRGELVDPSNVGCKQGER